MADRPELDDPISINGLIGITKDMILYYILYL